MGWFGNFLSKAADKMARGQCSEGEQQERLNDRPDTRTSEEREKDDADSRHDTAMWLR